MKHRPPQVGRLISIDDDHHPDDADHHQQYADHHQDDAGQTCNVLLGAVEAERTAPTTQLLLSVSAK